MAATATENGRNTRKRCVVWQWLRLSALLWISAVHQVLCWRSVANNDSQWMHSLQLDVNYDVYWSIHDQEVTFEVQVATLGYIIFGISNSDRIEDADIVVGWVENGLVRFQDRHGLPNGESLLDSQQDYDLMNAYENETHTVMKFQRKLYTCDDNDVNITAATLRILYAYCSEDPKSDLDISFANNPHGSKITYIINKSRPSVNMPDDVKVWDLRNVEVPLPESEDTLYWCRIFKLPPLDRKHHMIRYEPLFTANNQPYIHHMNIYECNGDPSVFEVLAATEGTRCYQSSMPPLFFNCNNVVVAWTTSSEGFTFPIEAGYPMNRASGAKFFMLETHYDNPDLQSGIVDSSGMRLFYTSQLRHHDAGVLSVGIDPNWKHIVPPGQRQVISEAHCVADCTQQALPSRGINVFAVNLHTHLLGRQVHLRHVRGETEMPSLVDDPNYDVGYQGYRQFQKPINILPGDHLISQCTYNSESRNTITLGGLSTREETCLAYLLYWPRVDLSLCYSLPSLATILHSLGIEELYPDSEPVRIKSPRALLNQTVEERLITFDWEKNFQSFQDATRRGAFRPLCWLKTQALIDGSNAPDYYAPNVSKPLLESPVCAPRGTLPPRLTNIKNPHRKNLNGSSGSHASNRNRSNTRSSSSTTASTTTRAYRTTTESSTEELVLSPIWSQGIPLNQEKISNPDIGTNWAVSVTETPLNDVQSSTEETVETASEELSSRGSITVTRSGSSRPTFSTLFTIILFAFTCCTYISRKTS